MDHSGEAHFEDEDLITDIQNARLVGFSLSIAHRALDCSQEHVL